MKLKQLEIVGFKSFVDKTTVQFPDGISAVVGPNGCGKSNIVDAIRWVMGEQSVKQLRGKAMEDVIFAGSEQRGPTNMAEVALTIDNDNGSVPEEYRDFSEIMVSRRLFRSGESGYYINKQPCRLKDVQSLLMGTGIGSKATYAIIEQGRIGSLIDAGPEERRFYIEEAAGITRYKSRKHEALLKIKRTEHNLLRISDVIAEVKRQMNSLKRQARKAERYKTLQEKIKDLETKLAVHQFKAISSKMDETEKLQESLRDSDYKHESELAKLDAAIEQIKEARTARYQHISEERARKYDTQRTLDRLEGDMAHRAKDLQRLDGEIRQFKVEAKSIEAKAHEIAKECEHLEQRKSDLQVDIQRKKETLKEAVLVENGLKVQADELNRSLEAQKVKLVNLASQKAAYQNTLDNASHNRANLSKRLSQLADEKGQSERTLSSLNEEIAGIEDSRRTLTKDLDQMGSLVKSVEERLTVNRQALSTQVRKVQEAELERQKTRSQLAALKKMDENYEWSKKGVRIVMKEWKAGHLEGAGICCLVADVIEPEPSYESAVEAALGDTLQYVLVKEQDGGMQAIDALRSLSGGKGGFVPLETVRSIGDSEGPSSNDENRLIKHMTIRDGYQGAVRALLGHVRVAGSLGEALELWNNNSEDRTIVTKQGDRVCLQGILTGGGPENGEGGVLTKKKEIKDLSARVQKLDKAVEIAKEAQKHLESEAVALESELQKTREAQNRMNQQLVETEKELYRLQERRNHAQRHIELLVLETEQLEGEWTDVDSELSEHQEVINSLVEEIRAAEQAVEQAGTSVKEISERLKAASDTIVEIKLQLTTLEAEFHSAENTLRRMNTFRDDGNDRLAQLRKSLKQTEEDKIAKETQGEADQAALSDLYAELEAIEERLTQSENEYQTIEGTLQQNDQALSEVRSRQQETFQKIQQLELKQSERRMRREHLVSHIHEKYRQELPLLAEEIDTEGLAVEETEQALTHGRERIARIGEVNLTAIEEYEALSERYGILTGQHDDLVDAIEALHHIIRRINRITLKRFMKTFKKVDQKVQTVFPKLFEGGTAKLAMTNPRRPLESGISFLVRPPGKKLTRMSLLSGGEKALSAIALVFSIFLIKPAAFCVLDEIDAPLDDVNVYRFNQLVKEIGQQSQVVMITHDRQTMEVANALFGVTMEQKGISKLISLDMSTS
jgi:chromosome segregation protein